MIVKYAWLAAAASAIAAQTPAFASTIAEPINYQLLQSYEVASAYDLHHGITYNTYANGAGFTNSFNLSAPGGTITDGFPKDPANAPLLTYIMFTSNLADEIDGESTAPDGHLVIGLNDSFAAGLLLGQQDFSETFSGYDESSLINALTLLDTPDLESDDPGREAQKAAKDQAVSLIFNFSGQVGTLGGLTQADGGTMTLVSFSTPGLAGTASSTLTRVPVTSAAPEPASWALMVAGFGALGAALRRRRTTVAFG